MVKSSEKSFDEVILQEALEYIAKVEELKGLEEEYKKTYEERHVIGNKIITLREDLLRLQGSFN